MRASKNLWVTAACVLAVLLYVEFQPRQSALADLERGWFGDHIAHMNAARAAWHEGFVPWGAPAAQVLTRVSPETVARLNANPEVGGRAGGDSFVCGRNAMKPCHLVWSQYVRPYPPGDLLAVAPVAFLYDVTSMSFARANKSLVMLFVLGWGLTLLLCLTLATRHTAVGAFLVAMEALRWSLSGFYDAMAVAPLLLAALSARDGRWAKVAFWLSAATFFHYRAFLFFPLGVWAVVELVRGRFWRSSDRTTWPYLAGAAVLLGLSLATFVSSWAGLRAFPLDNPFRFTGAWQPHHVGLAALLALASWGFAKAGSLLDVAMGCTVVWFAAQVQQAFAWHVVLMLPWAVLPVRHEAHRSLVHQLRLVLLIAVSAVAFRNALVPAWLALIP